MSLFPEITPITIPHADVPYTMKGVQLSIGYRLDNDSDEKRIVLSAHVRTVPIRVLPDGTFEQNEQMAVNKAFGDVEKDAATDPKLAAAVVAISGAIKAYMA